MGYLGWRKAKRTKLTQDWMDKKVGRTVFRNLKREIKAILYECDENKPAEVVGVSIKKTHLRISINWPFVLPIPTRIPEDWLATSQDVNRFGEQFRQFLLEQHSAAKLSNLMYGEFCKFLPRYFGAYRFAHLKLKRSVIARMRNICKQAGKRRLAGRREPHFSKKLERQVGREGKKILKTIGDMQKKIKDWKLKEKGISEAALKDRLQAEYDSEGYTWMQYFLPALRKLGPKPGWGKAKQKPRLSEPRSWSAIDLTRLIVWEKYYRETGVAYPMSELKRVVVTSKRPS